MALFLDHTIVPCSDKEASAKFIAGIFNLEYNGLWGPFAPVKFNETLSMDFDDRRAVNHPVSYTHLTLPTSDLV